MNYHVISTSNAGHGAIFTNKTDAKAYQKQRPGASYSVLDQMPYRIPSKTVNGGVSITESVGVTKGEITMIDSKADITVYTDGSCIGNPGPAGSGVVIMQNGTVIHEMSESLGHATNNIAELTAIKLALEYLVARHGMSITVYTDSTHCIGALTKLWKLKKNIELIASIKELMVPFTELSFKHVNGHNGDPGNERADKLANIAAHGENLMEDVGYNG